ncbi:MAG TPA: cytochrome c [Pyrinomonadaceae bacterium]
MRKSISLSLVAFSLLVVVAILTVISFDIAITSSAQNANSPVTTNKNSNQNDSRSIQSGAGGGQQQDFSQNTWELPEDADKTKNPVASSPESIEKGKALYLERTKGNCVFCHGETGAGADPLPQRIRRKPADISNKERMATRTDGELFWKISKGITGIMPAGERRMNEEERWHVVNYIRTLVKEKQ